MRYETRIDEAGQSLSGGQRQRLAIARAIAGSPAFLLLDEATSHLDAVTEAAVDRNLDALCCTRVVIAHRLSTIRNADLIVVVENGSIAEQGSHQQLLARNGLYAALIRNQSGSQEDCRPMHAKTRLQKPLSDEIGRYAGDSELPGDLSHVTN
jgi:ABC-type bacteriocin/lantibiotic exporter with double-glycine peptidase domain